MEDNLHERIIYSSDIRRIGSSAFRDSILHIICNSGCVSFKYNNNRFRLKHNEIAVISRPDHLSEINFTPDATCEYIAAPDRFLHNLLPANNYSIKGSISLFDNPVIVVSEDDAMKFRTDITNIRTRMSDTDHHFYTEMIGSLLQTMIYDLFNFHVKENKNILTTQRVGYITAQFFALIESGKPATEREVKYYAGQLHVSPKYLSDTIKRVSGMSVSTHINRAAAAYIIEYLNDNKLSITQIADRMNFSSVSHFSRYCSKHIGISPSQFRTVRVKNRS